MIKKSDDFFFAPQRVEKTTNNELWSIRNKSVDAQIHNE